MIENYAEYFHRIKNVFLFFILFFFCVSETDRALNIDRIRFCRISHKNWKKKQKRKYGKINTFSLKMKWKKTIQKENQSSNSIHVSDTLNQSHILNLFSYWWILYGIILNNSFLCFFRFFFFSVFKIKEFGFWSCSFSYFFICCWLFIYLLFWYIGSSNLVDQ